MKVEVHGYGFRPWRIELLMREKAVSTMIYFSSFCAFSSTRGEERRGEEREKGRGRNVRLSKLFLALKYVGLRLSSA